MCVPVIHLDRKILSTRPLLRWAGSKRRLLHQLLPYLTLEHRRYVEPFAGSACLFFALRPSRAIIADTNGELIDAYTTICNFPQLVYEKQCQLVRSKEAYYIVRSLDPQALPPVDRAARFIYLNRFCFGGLYRTNKDGMFNVPYGGGRGTGEVPPWEDFHNAALALRNAELVHGDFEATLECTGAGDLVYIDPPYAVSGRRVFREYGAVCFGESDLERLKNALVRMTNKRAHFVLSYADCPEAHQAFREWHIKRVTTRRSIACSASCRRTASEILVSSFIPPANHASDLR